MFKICEAISEEQCKEICACVFENSLEKMRLVYEKRIACAVLTSNLIRAKLFQRDLVVIKKLERAK